MGSSFPGGLDNFATNHAGSDPSTGHASWHNDANDAINKMETYSGSQTADFVIFLDGSTWRARNMRTGLLAFSGSDPAAVLHSVLNTSRASSPAGLKTTAGNAVGKVVLTGTMTWGSIPSLPPVPTGTTPDPRILTIAFDTGAQVNLGASGQRFLDFGRTADHDWFGNLYILNALIDGTSLPTGQKHHVILGTLQAGSVTNGQRINIQNIFFDNPRTTNIPVDSTTTPTTMYKNISLQPYQPTAGEGTQNYLKDIVIRNFNFDGGNVGIELCGIYTVVSVNSVNVLVDRCYIDGGYHTLRTAPTVAGSQDHIHIGQAGMVGRVLIRNVYGEYSTDVGIEIDQGQDVLVEDCIVRDAYGAAFLYTKFREAPSPGSDRVVFKRCKALHISIGFSSPFYSCCSSIGGATVQLGTVEYHDCVHLNSLAVPVAGMRSMERTDVVSPSGTAISRSKMIVRNFKIIHDSLNITTALTIEPVVLSPTGTGVNEIDIDGIELKWKGTYANTGGALRIVKITGGTNLDCRINNVRADFQEIDLSGMTTAGNWYMFVLNTGSLVRPLRLSGSAYQSTGGNTKLGFFAVLSDTTDNNNEIILGPGNDMDGVNPGYEAAITGSTKIHVDGQRRIFRPTYASSMVLDYHLGREQKIVITDGTAFSIDTLGTLVPGAELFIILHNNSGGAAGTITWSSKFKDTAGGTVSRAAPATGSYNWIHFRVDTVRGVMSEIARSGTL